MTGQYKHYIRVIDGNIVDYGCVEQRNVDYSDYILLTEFGGESFELLGEIDPEFFDERQCHRFRYENGEVRYSTQEELDIEYALLPDEFKPKEEETIEQLKATIEMLEECVIELAELISEGK